MRVPAVIGEVLDALSLRATVVDVGLELQVGTGGSRLSLAQRQRAAIARALLKRPDLLILNEATTALDGQAQAKVSEGIRQEMAGRGLIWVLHRASLARDFDRVLVMSGGKLQEQGTFAELEPAGYVDRSSAGGGMTRRGSAEPGGSEDVSLVQEFELLRRMPFFAEIEPARLKLLAFMSERVGFDAGKTLFRQGDAADAAYLIIEGEADILVDTPTGPVTIATLGRQRDRRRDGDPVRRAAHRDGAAQRPGSSRCASPRSRSCAWCASSRTWRSRSCASWRTGSN